MCVKNTKKERKNLLGNMTCINAFSKRWVCCQRKLCLLHSYKCVYCTKSVYSCKTILAIPNARNPFGHSVLKALQQFYCVNLFVFFLINKIGSKIVHFSNLQAEKQTNKTVETEINLEVQKTHICWSIGVMRCGVTVIFFVHIRFQYYQQNAVKSFVEHYGLVSVIVFMLSFTFFFLLKLTRSHKTWMWAVKTFDSKLRYPFCLPPPCKITRGFAYKKRNNNNFEKLFKAPSNPNR